MSARPALSLTFSTLLVPRPWGSDDDGFCFVADDAHPVPSYAAVIPHLLSRWPLSWAGPQMTTSTTCHRIVMLRAQYCARIFHIFQVTSQILSHFVEFPLFSFALLRIMLRCVTGFPSRQDPSSRSPSLTYCPAASFYDLLIALQILTCSVSSTAALFNSAIALWPRGRDCTRIGH
jgi:hypothetical protein